MKATEPKSGRRQYRNYHDYWLAYLEAHSLPQTRACHYLATVVGAGLGIPGLVLPDLWLLAIGVGCGYAIAISSHFIFQKNRPLVNRPLWGAISDLRMCFLALTGRLAAEYKRHGITEGARSGER